MVAYLQLKPRKRKRKRKSLKNLMRIWVLVCTGLLSFDTLTAVYDFACCGVFVIFWFRSVHITFVGIHMIGCLPLNVF